MFKVNISETSCDSKMENRKSAFDSNSCGELSGGNPMFDRRLVLEIHSGSREKALSSNYRRTEGISHGSRQLKKIRKV